MTDFFYTWSRQAGMNPLPVERAEHDEFVLADGRRVYDFVSTSFQAHFGHSCQPIIDAISQQLTCLPLASPKAVFPLKERATGNLIRLIDAGPGRIFYTVSGAESVENAIKISRRITGRPIVLARRKSYHGATLGAMSVSGDWRRDDHLNFEAGTIRIPEPADDPDCRLTRQIVEETGPANIAALIIETISGTNGVYIPPQSWMDGLRKLCDDFGIVWIVDEVLVGFGRCASPFAFQHYQVRPDMLCMSKGITGGYVPFGAVWVSDRLAGFFDDRVLTCGLTNYSHPLGLAAMDAVLGILDDVSFQQDCRGLEQQFARQVTELAARYSATEVRCRGLLAAIEFGDRVLPGWEHWVRAGLYLFTKGNMMILAPPLTSRPERMAAAFQCLQQTFAKLGS